MHVWEAGWIMNKHIAKLYDEAIVLNGNSDYIAGELDVEKFAELIVRECATVQHKRFCEHGDVSWDILMEHFGVRE